MSRGTSRSLLVALLAVLAAPATVQAAVPVVSHVDTPQDLGVNLATQVRQSRLAGVRAVSAGQRFLPTTWCGSEQTADDTADSTLLPGQAYYKLVYAYAADQPDRFGQWKDVLQADVSLIGQYMAMQDGATKTPRFDMGTSCGPAYVDIQSVRLPGTRASYADQFDAITAAVGAQLGSASGPRDVVILADGLTNSAPGSLYGLGQSWGGPNAESPGPDNPHNGGGLYAALFPPVGYDPAVAPGDSFYPGFWPEGMLHELTHTLGAVMPGAPHATSYGHCTDGYDVMCYADGGSSAAPYTATACPQLSGSRAGMTQTYDCGRDDYFNPSPPPGSYLASHWNVFNSAFEAPCSTLGDACGGPGDGTGAAPAPAPVAAPPVTNPAPAPPAPPATVPASAAAHPRGHRWHRKTVRLLRGTRTVLRVRVSTRTSADTLVADVAAGRAHLARRGAYRLTLCAGHACVSRRLHSRRGRARVPRLVAVARRGGPVTISLVGPGGPATGALT